MNEKLFKIYTANNNLIFKRYYPPTYNAKMVKTNLVVHEGFSPEITVVGPKGDVAPSIMTGDENENR